MHIAILSPSDNSFIINFLPNKTLDNLPIGYCGAPFIGTIIDELLKLNHQVTAITTTLAINNDYTIKEFSFGHFKWIVVPQRPHSFRMNGKKMGYILDFFAHEQKQMVDCLQKISPDIVHAHWSYEFAGAAIKSGIPYLVTVHDNAFQILRFFKNLYRFGRLLMSEKLLNQVRFASTVSPYMLPYVNRKCSAVRVIPNPTVIEIVASAIDDFIVIKSQTLNTPRFIMINNGWDKRKNGITGLLAFKKLQQQFPIATLQLFGQGSELNGEAHQDILKLQLKNVFCHGAIPHHQLIEELKKAHLLIHPALEESFGVVLIEAMSFGIPVVGGIHSGGVPWVIQDEQLLVDVTNASEMGTKLTELVTDADKYRQLSRKVYDNVLTRFSVKTVVHDYLCYYHDIIKVW
jgi:glycosyltransferase involved in cell wall biosynthesis